MLLTIFSASNYGGVCRNRGGVLIFDEKGPAEVKEFYAPPLDEHRRSVASESQATPGARLRRDGGPPDYAWRGAAWRRALLQAVTAHALFVLLLHAGTDRCATTS